MDSTNTPPSRKKPLASHQGLPIEKVDSIKNENPQVVKVNKHLFKQMEQAAKRGDAKAQFNLAVCYHKGEGVAQNHEKAVEWYQKSAQQGFSQAQFNLANCYRKGVGVAQNHEKAVEWFEKSAQQGFAQAQLSLALCYHKGIGIVQSDEEAFEWFKKSAQQGDAQAQLSLALCYHEGVGVAQHHEKAVEWFEKSAQQGDAEAQFNLAVCYEKGKGVAQNHEKAFEWYQKSAQQGFAKAQFNLANHYHEGVGVEQNDEKSLEWLEKAAKQDSDKNIAILAQYALATAYKQGRFGAINLSKAKEYLHEITDDKEINSILEGIQEIDGENQEQVIRVIRQVSMNALIELERQEAKEKADKEMLSFLTHTLNNSLGTVDESIHIIISTLGTDYKEDANKFKAVSRLLSLANIFSVTNTLIQMFKQYITEPENFKTKWKQDNKGSETIYTTLAFALQQTVNRLFFRLSSRYLAKFFPQFTNTEQDQLKQQFVQEILFIEDKSSQKIIEWLKNEFDIIELEIDEEQFHFEKDGIRFTFLFSIFSEIIYNAIRYATEKPIKVTWSKNADSYCFTCSNRFSIEKRYKEEKSQQGLVFIRRLLTLLHKSELIVDDTEDNYTITVKLHQDNFI
ncbi:tetratricopeptide repeat protein [Beggiatoa leptomitoformis]|uniref:Sel1 repeat family protein n=1 Tax=Beggiatoa leptomitoformis TaxID=288004 RepID=A0A2N9YDM1_9GAMM|nr:tetratricopeptide repeat protein [Beggiatoa leptomitoformis]AUI68556.1 hypothetical protein BLE401_07450 [Beggiatoa leptomitoformis]QGX03836.1 hypothetical protein AL038_19520 [Beggiatoa leptomitoformis]